MARVGGGYATIEDFVKKHEASETRKAAEIALKCALSCICSAAMPWF